ncbi:penicillin-binding protein 2 [bacterium]|nr:penicillin-binding protein 2 [bacterium]
MLWDHFIVRKEEQFQKRIKLLGILVVSLLGCIILQLAYLQLFQGKRYLGLSARNRVRLVPIKAQRGLIYDRAQELLVGNVSSFVISVIPAALPKQEADQEKVFVLLQDLLGIPVEEIKEKIKKRKLRYYEPIRLKSNLDRSIVALIEENRPELPGVVVLTESRRHYKFNSLGFHVLGYVGEISEHQLALREGYQAGGIIGQSGVEKVYDHYLKGRNGWLHIEVDALGRQMGILGREAPWIGHNLILSLDRKLQARAEEILGDHKGVIIVEDLRNGEILALASAPAYDPNSFAWGISRKAWEKLRLNTNYPLTNRATQGLYPPGSLFKIVTLMAALEEKLVTPYKRFYCKGIFWISTWPYRCWREDGHKHVDAVKSLVQSCDVYYYQLGLRIKVDKLGKWARSFGYGHPSGIDLPNELSGLVPSAQWKERTQNMPWFPGNTVMMSIGQGYILATPMQILNTIVAVANRGEIYRPHLLKEVRSMSGKLIHEVKPEIMYKVNASAKHWKLLQKSLLGVVSNKHGTGKRARVQGIKVAGKTATSQNPHGEDHAAFGAYAPAHAPEIAVLVYLENAGGGGSIAAPLARQIMEAYFGIPSSEKVEAKPRQ